LTDIPCQKKVLIKRESVYPECTCNASTASISIIYCGSAAGQLILYMWFIDQPIFGTHGLKIDQKAR
jgi:hypothetical protein